jgi:hypothetical protein
MEIPERFSRYFNAAGVPVTPMEKDTDTKVVLTREYLLDLCLEREPFFDTVTLFQPLRNVTLDTLQKLEKKGIINGKDIGKGCRACKQKALVSVLLQILKHIQTLIVQYRSKDKLKEVGDQIRKFIGKPEVALIIVLRTRTGSTERIEF